LTSLQAEYIKIRFLMLKIAQDIYPTSPSDVSHPGSLYVHAPPVGSLGPAWWKKNRHCTTQEILRFGLGLLAQVFTNDTWTALRLISPIISPIVNEKLVPLRDR
jgi:hypothetical protein